MRCRLVLASSGVAVAALVALGCSGASDDDGGDGVQAIEVEDDGFEPEAAPDPEPEPEDSEAEPDPEPEGDPDDPFAFDDPSEIDVDYVDRVMAELLAVVGDVLKDVIGRNLGAELESADFDRVGAVFSGPRLAQMGQSVQDYARDSALRSGFVPLVDFDRPMWTTTRVIHAEDACIVAVGVYDLARVSVEPFPDDELTAMVLSAMGSGQPLASDRHNVTGWRIHEQAQLVRGEDRQPVKPDELGELDYEGGLTLPCESFEVRQ